MLPSIFKEEGFFAVKKVPAPSQPKDLEVKVNQR
jgi:hypothetical protein